MKCKELGPGPPYHVQRWSAGGFLVHVMIGFGIVEGASAVEPGLWLLRQRPLGHSRLEVLKVVLFGDDRVALLPAFPGGLMGLPDLAYS